MTKTPRTRFLRRLSLCLAFLSITFSVARAQSNAALRNLQYDSLAGVDPKLLQLDLYFRKDIPPKGIVVFVHGGSWIKGDKQAVGTNPSFVTYFTGRGYAVASVNYRHITPEDLNGVRFDDQARDIARSVAWIYKNASSYSIENSNMILFGHSSGAHMVALLNTNSQYLTEAGVPHSAIKAVLSSDVHAYDIPLALKLMKASPLERNIVFLSKVFRPSEQKAASPISYLNDRTLGGDPKFLPAPSLLLSAGLMQDVSAQVSEIYKDKLRQIGAVATHSHFARASHASLVAQFGRDGHSPTQAVGKFLSSLGL
jgi:acetyl esterase/lipase